MRRAVFAISLAYAILFAWSWISTATGTMDAAGRGMALGFLMIGIIATAIFVVPALVLAIRNKALNWALGLSLTPAILLLLVSLNGIL